MNFYQQQNAGNIPQNPGEQEGRQQPTMTGEPERIYPEEKHFMAPGAPGNNGIFMMGLPG